MSVVILFSAIVIFSCVLTNRLLSKLGMPALIVFMFLGMLFGVDGIFKLYFDNFELTSKLCSIALLFIIFYGGFCTRKPENNAITVQAGILSSLGTVLTAFLTCAFCYYALKISFAESFLIGAVLSSTDAASVFSILRSHKLNLKYDTAPLLEIESGSNDPFAYMLTILGITVLKGANAIEIAPMFFAQIGFGVLFGVLTALFGVFIFKKTRLIQDRNSTLFTAALALASFAAADLTGGNCYLSVYLTGIILGNSDIINKENLLHFFDGVTGLCQITIFFLLGFLATPHKLFEVIAPTILISLFLFFVSRPVALCVFILPFRAKLNQIAFISAAGLRGAASIVFAIVATMYDNPLRYDMFHIVFFVSLLSIGFQGTLLPWCAKKLNMTDRYSNVLKTFNDYQNESAITLAKMRINDGHPWQNKQLKDINTGNSIVLVIYRDGCKIVPRGETAVLKNDLLLIGTTVTHSSSDIKLREMEIDAKHEWKNKQIKNIKFDPGFLIALIKRGGKSFPPNGQTRLAIGDIIVFYNI